MRVLFVFGLRCCVVLLLAVGILGGAHTAGASVAQGDAAFARRAVLRDAEGRAEPGAVRQAVGAYRAVLSEDPGHLEAHWKLLRALHFEAEFTTLRDDAKRAVLDRGVEDSDLALAVLELRVGRGGVALADDPERLRRIHPSALRDDAARIHFFSALLWGNWSQTRGVLPAIRKGVVRRLRDHSRVVVALEPALEGGGGHRLLANLHARLPRVPFYTGWVDRGRAIPEVERALVIAPEHPGNRLLYALLRLDLEAGAPGAPLAELEAVAALPPRPEELAEDLAIRRTARARLAKAQPNPVRAGP